MKARNAVLASWYKDIDFANPPDFPNHEYDYNPLVFEIVNYAV